MQEEHPKSNEEENIIKRKEEVVKEDTLKQEEILPCIKCKKFFGHTENMCSQCFAGVYPSLVKSSPLPINEDSINTWIETGVHNSFENKQCTICLETKKIITNFACNCHPVSCVECNTKIDKCPYCSAGKYVYLNKSDIKLFLENKFNKSSIMKVLKNHFQNESIKILPFKFEQFICHVSDIDEVVKELKLDETYKIAQHNCTLLHQIYCFAGDFWKTKCEGSGFILCYKNFGMDNIVKNYKNINSSRLMHDSYGVMKIELSDGK